MHDDGTSQYAGRFLEAPIGATKLKPRGVRWRRMLVIFMRIAAVVWLAKGLINWAFIIGLTDPGFPDLRLSRQGIIMAFAVLDIVAAVGLWFASSWGAAVWLTVLVTDALLPFAVPDLTRPLMDAVTAVFFGVSYLFFMWKAMKEDFES